MPDDDKSPETQIALFRYGVIADLLHFRPGVRSGLYKELKKKAAQEYTIPFSLRRDIAPETIRGWLADYRRGGFDALKPKKRADAGRPRSIPQDVIDALVTIKEEHPAYSVAMVIHEARRNQSVPKDLELPLATAHRHLTRAGVMKPIEAPSTKDRRHFAFAKAGELWMSDVMHGPSVTADGRRKRKT